MIEIPTYHGRFVILGSYIIINGFTDLVICNHPLKFC
jgi:hypothetical protein